MKTAIANIAKQYRQPEWRIEANYAIRNANQEKDKIPS
jgi:hypothetical protein